jgi:hypothetical protein
VHRSRHALKADTIREMHYAFQRGGRKAIERVMREQPAVFLKLLVLLVPRELQVEHKGGVKAMTDEQLEAGIEAIKAMLEQRAGDAAKVIEGQAEPVALPPPWRKVRRKVRRTPEVEPSEQYAQSAARPPGEPASDIDTALVDSSDSA